MCLCLKYPNLHVPWPYVSDKQYTAVGLDDESHLLSGGYNNPIDEEGIVRKGQIINVSRALSILKLYKGLDLCM